MVWNEGRSARKTEAGGPPEPPAPAGCRGPARRTRDLQTLPVVYTAVHDLEAERFVGALGIEMIQPGVRSHLNAALLSSPLLRRRDKLRSGLPAPKRRRYIPSFDIPNRTGRVTAVGVRPQAGLDEPDNAATRCLGQEDGGGQVSGDLAGQQRRQLWVCSATPASGHRR